MNLRHQEESSKWSDTPSLWSESTPHTEATTERADEASIRTDDAASVITDLWPPNMTRAEKQWYYESPCPDEHKRLSRDMIRHFSVGCYTPVREAANPKGVLFPRVTKLFVYQSEVSLFNKTCTAEDLLREVNKANIHFEDYFYNHQYEDACYIGTMILYHLIVLLRPEDDGEKRKDALASFPNRISGKVCYPEGDLLLIPRHKWDNDKGLLAGLCHALLYLQKVMKAVNLLPGTHITTLSMTKKAGCPHFWNRPSPEVLRMYSLPESSKTHKIRLADPKLSSLSLFFKPLFVSKYIYLENEKTRYTVETLQFAFVVFQQLADTALWSKEFAYALFLIQNMSLVVKYMEIVLPLPSMLRRFYTFTMTYWYCGRIYFHLCVEQKPEMRLNDKYQEILTNYQSWSPQFYSGLEEEIRVNTGKTPIDFDRSLLFVLPTSKKECLLHSAEGYKNIKIPLYWKRSCVQQNYAVLFYCHKQLLNWEDSLKSSEKKFLFKETKGELYSILDALSFVRSVYLENMSQVTLNLLMAKCFFYLSILDVSQLINWRDRSKSEKFSIRSPSFETILEFSKSDFVVDDCEVDAAESLETLPPGVQEVVPTVQPGCTSSSSKAEKDAGDQQPAGSSVEEVVRSPPSAQDDSELTDVALTNGMIFKVSNIPVAVSNMLKANKRRLEGFESLPARKSLYLDFNNELYTAMSHNIMIHYINLQEYETDLYAPWQMTSDFADVLDKKYDSKYLTKEDGPMLNKTITCLFMGGCLVFYLMYRIEGDQTFYNNARYFYALTTALVTKFDLWAPVLKSLAEHVETRRFLLLDCHDNLRRQPDRCVAIIRSYIHMLPLLYEYCIMNKTKGGPTNCPRIRVRDVTFPFNVNNTEEPGSVKDITILQRVKDYLTRELEFFEQGGIITLLERTGCSLEIGHDEDLEFDADLTIDFNRTVPKYPALERWCWKKPEVDPRPLCTGDDDCEIRPCTVEEYIDEEEKKVETISLVDEPNFLNDLVDMSKVASSNFSTLSNTVAHLRKGLKEVTEKFMASLNSFHRQVTKSEEKYYVRVSIPGFGVAGQSRAAPNTKMDNLPFQMFSEVLKHSIGYLCNDELPDDLALCKALLCLDRVLNHEFKISDFLRGSIKELEDFLSSLGKI